MRDGPEPACGWHGGCYRGSGSLTATGNDQGAATGEEGQGAGTGVRQRREAGDGQDGGATGDGDLDDQVADVAVDSTPVATRWWTPFSSDLGRVTVAVEAPSARTVAVPSSTGVE